VNTPDPPTRRDFIRLAAAAGLIGPAAFSCRGTTPDPVPRSYASDPVARGIAALADVHHRGWVPGHHGAAVLAAHYFCVDNTLDERTTRAVHAQIEAYIARRPGEFPDPVPGSGTATPSRIVERLDGQVTMHRSGGHNVIYASLFLRALRDRPEFATPAIVDGFDRCLAVFAQSANAISRTAYNDAHPLAPYGGSEDVTDASLRAILRPWNHVREVGASGVVHFLTHGEALVSLEELGYGETARRGYAAHQIHINRRIADNGGREPDGDPLDWLAPEYWESERPRNLFGGTWLFGHAFKYPHSLFRLLRRTDDRELRNAVMARASKLTIPFE
jgi:hypothetical protein